MLSVIALLSGIISAQVLVATLNSPISAISLSLPVSFGGEARVSATIRVDDEQMLVCAFTDSTITICDGGRGANHTTATAHGSGANVYASPAVLQSNKSTPSANCAIAISAVSGGSVTCVHNLETNTPIVTCFDNGNPSKQFWPQTAVIDTNTVAISVATPQSGTCRISS